MKILFLTRSFYPNLGGVEIHVLELSKELIKQGHKITIITEENKRTPNNYQSNLPAAKTPDILKKIKVHRIQVNTSEKNKKFQIWKWLLSHKQLIDEADLIHCHDVFYWYMPFKFIFPFKKVFTTFHGYETFYPPRKRAVFVRRMSNLLSSGSIHIGQFIHKWYKTKADLTLYGGVRLGKVPEDSMVKGKIKILFVGRIEEDNGVHIFSEVLSILDNNNIAYQFEAIGDGSLRKEFDRFGVTHGWVNNPDQYISKNDLIFTSSYLSILAAFAHKKYVLAVYQNPLKKDYLSMTPFHNWMCVSNTAMDVAHKVIAFKINKESYKKDSDLAYEWVSHQTWKDVAKQYIKLWSK